MTKKLEGGLIMNQTVHQTVQTSAPTPTLSRIHDSTCPSPADVAQWHEVLSRQPEYIQEEVRRYHLDPEYRYALRSAPLRASYFKIIKMVVCADALEMSNCHIHLSLFAFNSVTGDVICQVDMVDTDDLLAYPYTDGQRPSQQLLDAEQVLTDKARLIEGMRDLKPGMVITASLVKSMDPLSVLTSPDSHAFEARMKDGELVGVTPVDIRDVLDRDDREGRDHGH